MRIQRANLVGERFGRLMAVEDVGTNRHSQSQWLCQCDCGGEKVASINALRGGQTRSCGCLRKNRARQKRECVPGTFRCSRCKQRHPLSEKIPNTNYRCQTCGPPKKRFSLPNRLWRRARDRALKHSLEFTITPDDITIPDRCPVLGCPLDIQGGSKAIYTSPSLDRFDSSKGYTPDNIEVISWRANTLKRNGTIEEFEHLVAWMKGRQ